LTTLSKGKIKTNESITLCSLCVRGQWNETPLRIPTRQWENKGFCQAKEIRLWLVMLHWMAINHLHLRLLIATCKYIGFNYYWKMMFFILTCLPSLILVRKRGRKTLVHRTVTTGSSHSLKIMYMIMSRNVSCKFQKKNKGHVKVCEKYITNEIDWKNHKWESWVV